MYNCISYDECSEQPLYSHRYVTSVGVAPMCTETNKFVYVKQQFTHQKFEPVRVLVNPNFNKKVFVNPNFNGTIKDIPPIPKIHVNPNAQNLKLTTDLKDCKNISKIHVNPNILRNVPLPAKNENLPESKSKNEMKFYKEPMNHTVISTRTKLVRSGAKNTSENRIRKRRSSIKSQFKIIKSSLLEKSIGSYNRIKSKYRLIKADQYSSHYLKHSKPVINKFKLDNRHIKKVDTCPKNKKYVYVNRFLSISDIARNSLLKQNKYKSVPKVGEVTYKKSPNSSRKASNPYKKTNNLKKIQGNTICKSKYKFMRKANNCVKHNQSIKQLRISRVKRSSLKNVSKLKICNIPCPYYRKFGRCKGKENGKCCRKHDPDQIALCTKFLQGACVDKKCLLSHNVSPEKMPTCKFYLEGSCSRDDCPYLHIRISPKADICKDFLEGFCKKAAECDKRHQFLCPDYEKNGNCQKQRCSYPHGKMVRKYSEFNKNKFAKKSSTDQKDAIENNCNKLTHKIKRKKAETVVSESLEVIVKSRYYIGQNNLDAEEICSTNQKNCNDCVNDQESGIKSRPKLGRLPSFISFETESI